jgi:hypothetical protein
LAIIPIFYHSRISYGLTSGTTNGTSGCILHYELLSMTTVPYAAAYGANILLVSPPAENRAISQFLKEDP